MFHRQETLNGDAWKRTNDAPEVIVGKFTCTPSIPAPPNQVAVSSTPLPTPSPCLGMSPKARRQRQAGVTNSPPRYPIWPRGRLDGRAAAHYLTCPVCAKQAIQLLDAQSPVEVQKLLRDGKAKNPFPIEVFLKWLIHHKPVKVKRSWKEKAGGGQSLILRARHMLQEAELREASQGDPAAAEGPLHKAPMLLLVEKNGTLAATIVRKVSAQGWDAVGKRQRCTLVEADQPSRCKPRPKKTRLPCDVLTNAHTPAAPRCCQLPTACPLHGRSSPKAPRSSSSSSTLKPLEPETWCTR